MSLSRPDQDGPSQPGLTRRALHRRLGALPLALAGCAGDLAGEDAPRPWHHTADGFRNPPGSPERGGDFGDWTGFFVRRFTERVEVALPDRHVLPEAEVRDGFARHNPIDALTWLGHASFLIQLDGRRVLTDPFLSDYASPMPPFGPKRFAPPPLHPARLPAVDVLLVSHNHYDHLDLPTIEALPGKKRIEVVVPLGLAGYFRERGYVRVQELDWYQKTRVDGLEVRALPAIHFSKRTPFDRNRTLWTGYAIQGRTRRIYFAGDTAYGRSFTSSAANSRPSMSRSCRSAPTNRGF